MNHGGGGKFKWRYVKGLLGLCGLAYLFLAIFRPTAQVPQVTSTPPANTTTAIVTTKPSSTTSPPPTAIPYRLYKWPPFINVRQAVGRLRNGDKVTLYNNWRFKFLIQPKNRTQADPVPVFRVCVKSKVDHVQLRKAIRLTWGREELLHENPHWKFRLRTIFLLGKSENWTNLVQKEADAHGDILQGDFIEDYRNNTLKMLMGFHYLIRECADFDLVLFVDDDYFVSWPNILFVVSAAKRKFRDFSKLYVGFRWDAPPFRAQSAKHFVSLEEYPFDRYPPFIAAGAYIMSRESLTKFYLASYFVKPFKMDDVYMGMIAKEVRIRPVHSQRFDWKEPGELDGRNFSHLAAAHGFSDPVKIVKLYMEIYM